VAVQVVLTVLAALQVEVAAAVEVVVVPVELLLREFL
jgi:hypothetical protein